MVCISQLNTANQGQEQLQIALGKEEGLREAKVGQLGRGNAGKVCSIQAGFA